MLRWNAERLTSDALAMRMAQHDMRGIKKLDLSQNMYVAALVPAQLLTVTSLERLPSTMHMPQLEELFLQGNRIEELPFDWLAAFPNLRVLNVSSNRLKAVPSVAALFNLRRLLLNDNVICPTSLSALCGVRGRLEYISLERNPQLPGGVAKYADGAEAAQIMLAHIATFCKQPFGDVPLVQSKQLQD